MNPQISRTKKFSSSHFFRILFRGIATFTAFAAVLCLLQYFLPPQKWFLPQMAGVGFPILWPVFFFIVLLSFFWWKRAAAPLTVLFLPGLPFLADTVAVNPPKAIMHERPANALRIMSWNVSGPQTALHWDTASLQRRQEMKAFIREWAPDVLMFQDFGDMSESKNFSNIQLFRDTLGFSHVQFVPWYQESFDWGTQRSGSILFSKIPFVRTGASPFPGRQVPELIMWADIPWPGDATRTVRLATTHFHSMNLFTDYIPPDEFRYNQLEDSAIIQSKSIFRKLKYYQAYHGIQAAHLRAFTEGVKLPIILAADLNSIPASWVYRKAKGNLNDAFLSAGNGWGPTFDSAIPWLRIDYVFHSPQLQLQQYKAVKNTISDHYPIVADFTFPH